MHQLGVVGIMFDIVDDRTNPAFDAILGNNDTFNAIKYPPTEGAETTIIRDLDISQMIPDHLTTEGFYHYKGSLTTPPCTNIVNWHVMNARGYIGRSQMEKFRELMSTETYKIAPNYREAQVNTNKLYSCVDTNVVTEIETVTDYEESWIAVAAVISFLVAAILVGVFSYFKYQKTKQRLIEEINRANKRQHAASMSSATNV